jgi:hypothetical protein
MSDATNLPLTGKVTALPADLFTGYIRSVGGRSYILLKAAGIIGDGALVMKDTTSSTEITVTVTSGATVTSIGVNNIGGSIAVGEYFWALYKGRGYVAASATTFSDGDRLQAAAAGEAATIATGNPQVGVAILDRSATASANAVLFDLPSNYNA